MPPTINYEALERTVRHELVPVVDRNAEGLIDGFKLLVEKAVHKGTLTKKNADLISKTGKALDNEFVTFTRQHADAVVAHLDEPASVQHIHNAVSAATKGRNLEIIAQSAQDGRALNVNHISFPAAHPNKYAKSVLQSVPRNKVPGQVMDGVMQELERNHNLDGVISKHIDNAIAQSRDPVRQAITRLPEGQTFLDAYQAESHTIKPIR